MNHNSAYHVTRGGECLEIAPQSTVDPVNRDGVLYKFHVTDLRKNRGKRLVSVFATGSVETPVPDHQRRIQTACINTIRSAFDEGTLSFDQPRTNIITRKFRCRHPTLGTKKREPMPRSGNTLFTRLIGSRTVFRCSPRQRASSTPSRLMSLPTSTT